MTHALFAAVLLAAAPELFYRNANLSARGVSERLQTIGLELSLVYY